MFVWNFGLVIVAAFALLLAAWLVAWLLRVVLVLEGC